MTSSWQCLAATVCVLTLAACASGGEMKLNANDLYSGYEARKVLLDKKGKKLSLDPRVFKFGRERKGVVCTDPIDLGVRDGIIGLDPHVTAAAVEVLATVPKGASVLTETRTGANLLDTSAWSKWKTLRRGKGTLRDLAGRYIQVRMTLRAPDAKHLPALTGLVLRPTVVPLPREPWFPLKVVKADIQKIVRSAVVFHYERPDQPDIVKFRKAAKLDEVVKGARNDFEKLVKLMDWAGSCYNDRSQRPQIHKGRYTWDINRVFAVVNGRPTVYGHCMSYAEVMCYASIAMGYVSARHNAVGGFRQATHEVCDIWVPSLGKWVYFDPSLSSYYKDKKTRAPMSILETHKVIIDSFIPDGKDMHWFHQRRSAEVYAVMRKVGGKTPIICRLGKWRYGAKMPRNYNWGWSHSYLANGFVQMTPRNDFQSNPSKISRRFGNSPGYDGFPFWVDKKTPPTRGGHNWYTRQRDFYWTLDQASINLVRAGQRTIRVELGQTMPFFKKYQLTVNGRESTTTKSVYRWGLRPGKNTLAVAPVDEFGKVGLASSVTLELPQLPR